MSAMTGWPEPGEVQILDFVGDKNYSGDTREPRGLCRWCGRDSSDGNGLLLVRQAEGVWYECGACSRAISDYGLFDKAQLGDASTIRDRAAELVAEHPEWGYLATPAEVTP